MKVSHGFWDSPIRGDGPWKPKQQFAFRARMWLRRLDREKLRPREIRCGYDFCGSCGSCLTCEPPCEKCENGL